MWLFIAFIGVPILEIALFIQVGGWLGLWPTLGIVVLTAILGTILVRDQGLAAMGQIRSNLSDLRDPTEALAHGAMILASGLLLLTPGFFTDALGFALLVPAIRLGLFRWIRSKLKVQSFVQTDQSGQTESHHPTDSRIIDGDYIDLDDTSKKPPGPGSGWTRD